jgi:TetR/AcrR family transcriptional regulator, mexCD-oprJ operon repressor
MVYTPVNPMPEPKTADPRKATAERNLTAILDAGERLLRGDREPTISAVAAEAGVSRPTVYAHFKDRRAIVEAIVERAVERAMSAVRSARPDEGPAGEALERLVAASWEHVAGDQEIARAAAAELSADAMRRAHASAHAVIADLVERGRDEGAFRDDLPASWLVTSLLALIHAAAEEVRSGALSRKRAGEVLLTTVADLFAPPVRI